MVANTTKFIQQKNTGLHTHSETLSQKQKHVH